MPSITQIYATALLLVALFAPTGATTIVGQLQFPDKSSFNETVRIVLNHGELWTYSRQDGSFALETVPPGIHVLDVYSSVYHFSQYKIQLSQDDMDNPKCLEYAYPGAIKQPVSHPLVITAVATYDYFEKRPGFTLLALLRNPMLLMMAFAAGLMFLMPKLMEGMDDEEKEQMKRQMELQKDPSKMLGQLFGTTPAPAPTSKKNKTK